jgi:Amt family ammonium transporter
VVHTHGIAGLVGGLMVGLVADPNMIVYFGSGSTANVSVGGLFYGAGLGQLKIQAIAALFVIIWCTVSTFAIAKVVGIFVPLRIADKLLEVGDLAVHGEEVGVMGPLPATEADFGGAIVG